MFAGVVLEAKNRAERDIDVVRLSPLARQAVEAIRARIRAWVEIETELDTAYVQLQARVSSVGSPAGQIDALYYTLGGL